MTESKASDGNVAVCVCGLRYLPSYPPDVARHRREHDLFLHGIRSRPMRDDKVLYDSGALRVTLVLATSSIRQRKRVEALAARANWETHYDFGIYNANERGNGEFQTHALVGHKGTRAIALMLIERRHHMWVATWGDGEPQKVAEDVNRWTIVFVWVLPKFRRKGIASILAVEACKFLGVSISELGWYTPFSDSGRELARNLCPEQFYIIK